MTGRICASLSTFTGKEDVSDADMVEIRLDLLGNVPDIRDKDLLVTYRGGVDLSVLPEGFNGMIDVGEEPRPDTGLKVVSSYHDYDKTPDCSTIVGILGSMTGDIRKGAFNAHTFTDIYNIFMASKMIPQPHVLLGMGAMGKITRIRKSLLKNEFSFGYVGDPTAPGQLSIHEMRALGDDCIVTGILGGHLSKSKSPEMHSSAYRESGINGIYIPFETEDLAHFGDILREYDIRGVNVTIPHKQAVIDQLDSLDRDAEAIGAVNTVVNDDGKLAGYNTDIIGIQDSLSRAGFSPRGKRAVIMGTGGAARACAYILGKEGCRVTITGRSPDKGEALAKDIGCEFRSPGSVPVQMNDLIVNCTPIGMYTDDEYPLKLEHLNSSQTVFDMVYGCETPLMRIAKDHGCSIASGADMLASQGAASFKLWTGKDNMFDTMRSVL